MLISEFHIKNEVQNSILLIKLTFEDKMMVMKINII